MNDPDAAPPDLTLLAALDADLLDPEQASAVRAAALADPRSAAVLDGLATTRAELAALASTTAPADVRARWVAALDQERAVPRRPRYAWLGAAAAVLLLAGAGFFLVRGTTLPADAAVLAVARMNLAAAGDAAVGGTDLGALVDPVRRAACLRAVGTDAADAVLGGRRVLLDGRPGVLLVLATGTPGTFRLLVVDPACGVGDGGLLAETVLSR